MSLYISDSDPYYALFLATSKHDGTNYTVETLTIPAGHYNFSFYYNFPGSTGHLYVKLVPQTGRTTEILEDSGRFKEWKMFSKDLTEANNFKVKWQELFNFI